MPRLEPLADPVRLRAVRHLEDAGEASLQDLADAAGVHLNTVRPHVTELERAGVLERASVPAAGRGRPAVRYRLASGWTLPTSDFRGLAELLAVVLVRQGADREDMRAVGLEWGRYLLGRPGDHELERELPLALESLGFSVRLDDSTLALSSCPCSLVLPDRPELVCELAVAVVDGVLAGSGSGLSVAERAHDPATRHCSVRLGAGSDATGGRRRLGGINRRRRRRRGDTRQ